ncbi:hypothetical protein AB833_14390 [Chromatiales bacterium (ex Bugula neritina AB1)]|nr:hypothetical protein AB833_14390 [Chromatiales bacterium (ex Bugula neritina AB1)]
MYAVKNRYYKHSKLDEECFRRILELFAKDLTAVQCARMTGVNVRSVNSIYLKLRDRIAQWSESNASGTPGLNAGAQAVNPDEKHSGYLESQSDGIIGVRLFVQQEQVYCALLNPDANPPSIGDGGRIVAVADEVDWREYSIGIDVRRDMRLKLKSATFQKAYHAKDLDRVEAFGRFLRLRLSKFKGLRREKFYYHLKESEYRYNHRRDELYALLLGMLGEAPIE